MFQPQLSVSAHHGFIYLDDGRLYGFGDNRYGQLGHPGAAARQKYVCRAIRGLPRRRRRKSYEMEVMIINMS